MFVDVGMHASSLNLGLTGNYHVLQFFHLAEASSIPRSSDWKRRIAVLNIGMVHRCWFWDSSFAVRTSSMQLWCLTLIVHSQARLKANWLLQEQTLMIDTAQPCSLPMPWGGSRWLSVIRQRSKDSCMSFEWPQVRLTKAALVLKCTKTVQS